MWWWTPRPLKKAGRLGDVEGIAPHLPLATTTPSSARSSHPGTRKHWAAIQQYITKADESLVGKSEKKAAKHAARKAAAAALAEAEAAAAALETSEEGG